MTCDDPPDWDEIVDRHGKQVFRVALRIVGSVQDAEDVAQDTFVEAFRLHKMGPIHSWSGLLVRIATLRAIDRLRRKRPFKELRDSDTTAAIQPCDHAIAGELASWLRKAVALLPDQQATIFVMMQYEQLSREEVAASLGISPEAVSSALWKARQRLLSQLSVVSK